MPGKTNDQKKKDMDQLVVEFSSYWPCLLANQAEIESAAIAKDKDRIEAVFVNCKVPKKQWKKLMELIMNCPDMQPWG